jgi:hypothetical protein
LKFAAFGYAASFWQALRALLLLSALLVLGCAVPDYTFVPDEPAPPGPIGEGGTGSTEPVPPSTPIACTSDDDCANLASTGVCDSAAGYCVECDPARESDLARCGPGTFCASSGHCTLGCQSDAECLGITCDTGRGLCINCTLDADCTPGTACVNAVCTPHCDANADCPYAWLCCDGSCKNPETDATSCGACGKTCDAGGACWNGVCGEGPCAPGTAECDGDASNGCETPTTDDPKNCGKCKLTCASNYCAGGTCTTMGCEPGTADCNGREDDQCETDLSDVDNCLMCRHKCSDNHGTPSCDKDGCAIACDDGYDDCDADVTNGCEINLQTDGDHCGTCDTTCKNDHGTTECKDGDCVPRCANGFEDCDGNPANGCEQKTDTADHCGACGQTCTPANGSGNCSTSVCKVKCSAGYADCDGDPKNGCEANLSAPETCGSCDNRCSANGGKATCVDPTAGTCGIKCDAGHADCVNGVADGCETDTTVSVSNCGGCGNVCVSSVGTPACADSMCGLSDCTPPNAECVPNDGKKCETNVSNDAANCGGCGMACYYKNGKGSCTAAKCHLVSCDTGYEDCNQVDTDGCETALGTTANCRQCGESCTNDHGTNQCTSNGCQPSCAAGWGDCDGNKNNGCETQLNTLTDCGACGRACNKAHGTPSCASGSCQIAACNSGWDDCSASEATANDGCETQLNTLTNCNGCGVACNLAHGTASCGTGQCVLTGCNTGYADCSSQAGCETQLGTSSNCSACGDACTNAHGSTSCAGTSPNFACSPSCASGFKSCDGNSGNGCETDLHTLGNCGDCGVTCNLPNATSSCATGSCTVAACNTNFLDCTNQAGCETAKGTTSNCRSCGEACTNPHGTSACNATSGCTFACSGSDWGDCDSNPNNGCETSLTSLANCHSCGMVCDIPNSSESCSTGTCLATTCAAGFDDCDGNGSCETQLNSVTNCNACGHVCTAQNGTTSCSGSAGSYVCAPVCNAGFKSCDNNPDNGCERSVTTLTDCGNCNVVCSFANAGASCTTGTCSMGSCNAGFANCDNGSANGCEVQLGTISNCAACSNACTNAHGKNACTGAPGSYDCAPTCDAGYKSCDNNPDNGCETPLNTVTDCGDCGTPCSAPNGSASCATGVCVLTGCSAGFADCNAAPGCETQLGTAANCSACGDACLAQNGTNDCVASAGSFTCSPTCNAGFKSCDQNPDNGCERNIRTLSDCGDCNVPCSFTNASASCATGTCTFGSCGAGYASCDGSTANGCETKLGTDTNCSACGDVCSNSHGSNACDANNDVCVPVCSTGFGDCDHNPSNGCEADLTTATACGACGNVCNGSTQDCVNSGGVYKCQARVTYVNDVEGSANVDSTTHITTLDVSHTLGTGSNRFVLAAIVTESTQTAGLDGAKPTVTYGGVTMNADPSTSSSWSSDIGGTAFDNPYIYYYYLTDGGTNHLPASGTQTLHVTGAAGKVVMIEANVTEFTGVNQSAPLVYGTGNKLANPGSPCVATSPVTTALTGTALYVLSVAHFSGTATVTGSQLMTTPSWSAPQSPNQVRAYATFGGTNSVILAPGTYTIGFTWQWCNPAGDLPIGIVPYRQP